MRRRARRMQPIAVAEAGGRLPMWSIMPAVQSASSLFADLDVDVQPDAPIGAMTWYGIGGRADLLVHPHSVTALATLVKRCRRSQTPIRVLGAGANLLVDDDGVDGVVVKLDTPAFREVTYATGNSNATMTAMAGADMARTLMETMRRGLDGLSQMAGIPASIGGAIRMNAGGAYGCIGDAVQSVSCITRDGEIVTHERSSIDFNYRSCSINEPIIISAEFNVQLTDPIVLRERVKEIFAFKKSTQPLAEHSAGCSFRNPIDPQTEQRVPAGKLIDQAGLKGVRVGGAVISPQHANFIVAEPGATARDVQKLLEQVRAKVYKVHGIELETEVVIWKRGQESSP